MQENRNDLPTPVPSAEAEDRAAPQAEETDVLSALREELARCKEELTLQSQRYEAELTTLRQSEEFARLFPHVAPEAIPTEVRSAAEAEGLSLAAAYALYEKRQEARQLQREQINQRNAERAPGRVGIGTSSEYFTPDEVRRMTPGEVRFHMQTIRESMKTWH